MDTVVVSLDSLSKLFLQNILQPDSVLFSFDSTSKTILQNGLERDSFFLKFGYQLIAAILALISALLIWMLSRRVERHERIRSKLEKKYIDSGTCPINNYLESINTILRNIVDMNDINIEFNEFDTEKFPRSATINIFNLLNSFTFLRYLQTFDLCWIDFKKTHKKYLQALASKDLTLIDLPFEFFIKKMALERAINRLQFQMASIDNLLNRSQVKSYKAFGLHNILSKKHTDEKNQSFDTEVKELLSIFSNPMENLSLLPPAIMQEYKNLYGTNDNS